MVSCVVYLFALEAGSQHRAFFEQVRNVKEGIPSVLISGVPHGWVHSPRSYDRDKLLAFTWDLFILCTGDGHFENISGVRAYVNIAVSIPDEQFQQILNDVGKLPEPSPKTPTLPAPWHAQSHVPGSTSDAATSQNIPLESLVSSKDAELGPGELRLDAAMSNFLSTTLPVAVRSAPACFFNLFKYKNGDRAVHDSYMEGFKNNFGDAAGAQVKFMGPCASSLQLHDSVRTASTNNEMIWQDANLVQYDSVWHYAYMLSTDIYKELNKEKVSGLEDTCILLVSEIELVHL